MTEEMYASVSVNCDFSFTFLQLVFIKTSSAFSSVIVSVLFVVYFALPQIKTLKMLYNN